MKQLVLTIKRLLSYLPTKLPVGTPQFETFADSIIELSGQYADRDSMRFAIASMVIHADHKAASLSKNYFVTRLRKSAANQVASQVFQDIKHKQDEAAKLKQAEDSAIKAESDGQTAS